MDEHHTNTDEKEWREYANREFADENGKFSIHKLLLSFAKEDQAVLDVTRRLDELTAQVEQHPKCKRPYEDLWRLVTDNAHRMTDKEEVKGDLGRVVRGRFGTSYRTSIESGRVLVPSFMPIISLGMSNIVQIEKGVRPVKDTYRGVIIRRITSGLAKGKLEGMPFYYQDSKLVEEPGYSD
ncbi:MAG: hypothetical protein AABW73_01910 [Nanoarchaeota archaeon]